MGGRQGWACSSWPTEGVCFREVVGLTPARGREEVVTTPLRGGPRGRCRGFVQSAGRRHGGKKRNNQSGFFEED